MSPHRMISEAMRRIFGKIPELAGRSLPDLVNKAFIFTVRDSTDGEPEGYISQILGIKWVSGCCILKIHQTTICGKICTGIIYTNGAWHAKHNEDTYILGELSIF